MQGPVRRLAAAEEAVWNAAADRGELHLLPTKPFVAWKRAPPRWLDEAPAFDKAA